jgi:hypothetical protein
MVFGVTVGDIQDCYEWIRVRGGVACYFENLGKFVVTQPIYTQCVFSIISTLPNHAVVAPVVMRGSRYIFNYGERWYLAYKGYKKEEKIECNFKLENIVDPYFYCVVVVYENNTVLYQQFSCFDLLNQLLSPAVPMALLL